MIVREMIDICVPICKICTGALGRIMVYRDDYKGHLYFCKDCGTEYKIIGQGQAENELLMEYDNGKRLEAQPWEIQYELSKETENWNGCYPDPNLGHGKNWEKEKNHDLS